jgi:hypothetical protein
MTVTQTELPLLHVQIALEKLFCLQCSRTNTNYVPINFHLPKGQSQWPCRLRRGPAAVRLLRLRVRIPQGSWMSAPGGCCTFSGRILCFGADHSSSVVPPTMVCRYVWSRNIMNEQAVARFGPQLHRGKKLHWIVIVTNRKLKKTFVLPPSCYLSFCKQSPLMIASFF